MTPQLAEQAQAYRILKSELIEKYGFGEDDQALLDTLEGATDYIDQLKAMWRAARKYDAWVVANEIEIATLKARTESLKHKAARLRQLMASNMDINGPRRIDEPDFSVTLANGKQKLIGEADPNQLPDRFVRIKREVNRLEIFSALKSGEHVPGFSISNGSPHLRCNT